MNIAPAKKKPTFVDKPAPKEAPTTPPATQPTPPDDEITVIIPANVRIFSDYDTDLDLPAGREHKLNARQIRSSGVRGAVLQGRLRVVKGTYQFPYKDSIVVARGAEGGNSTIEIHGPKQLFIRDFKTNKTVASKSPTLFKALRSG